MALFRDIERTDSSPARYGEDSFSFLDRVDQKFWQRVRTELERWFAAYPADEASDLRARFRDKHPAQHFAAWWELYLHRLFCQLGFSVDIHPKLEGLSTRPDFRVSRPGAAFLVEAATTFSGIVDEDRDDVREAWIMAALDQAHAPDFFVGLDFEKVGKERPSVRAIVAPVEAWLSGLDPDAIDPTQADLPSRRFVVRDWVFDLRAVPVRPDSRGRPDHRVLGFGPATVGYVNDVEMLQRTLEKKRRKYGRPAEPLVLAILLMSHVNNEEIEQALLGRVAWQFNPADPADGKLIRQRDGFWMNGTRPRGKRVSAVISGTSLMPWSVATTWPRLWPNPWAERPLSVGLPFPIATADENGAVTYDDRDDGPFEIFGLPSDWPRPEDRFERS